MVAYIDIIYLNKNIYIYKFGKHFYSMQHYIFYQYVCMEDQEWHWHSALHLLTGGWGGVS